MVDSRFSENAFILGASSDIALELLPFFEKDRINVYGTYRSLSGASEKLSRSSNFYKCDIAYAEQVEEAVSKFSETGVEWDLFVSAVGQMKPIGKFFEIDFDRWAETVQLNTIDQLRFLHKFYPSRKKNKIVNVVFFAGGGTNGAFKNYSAYCASKIFLIKMCELLDDEYQDINAFIIGPGWVYSKIHKETIEAENCAGINFDKTKDFMQSGQKGTPIKDIYDMIKWGARLGKPVVSGRNFSVVHDPWRGGSSLLEKHLVEDKDKYKLRRHKND